MLFELWLDSLYFFKTAKHEEPEPLYRLLVERRKPESPLPCCASMEHIAIEAGPEPELGKRRY